MARRKEKERERREQYRPFRISDDFNDIQGPFDISGKHHSATNINALLRKTSSPSYRDGQCELYRVGQESPSRPLLRRCQTSRPVRPSKSTRVDIGGSSPRWRPRNKCHTRKPSKHSVIELSLAEDENKTMEVDFLRVEESVAVVNSTSSEKSSPASTRNEIDSDTGNRVSGSRSHNVIVFVENSKNSENGTLGEILEWQPLNKTKSLEIRRKRGVVLSSGEEKKDTNLSPPPILKRAACDEGIHSDFDTNLQYKADPIPSSQETVCPNLNIEQLPNLRANDMGKSRDECYGEENGAPLMINKGRRVGVSNSYEANVSFIDDHEEEKEDLCETDSSIELQTYLGGNIESSI